MNKITKNKKIFIFIIIGLALIILIASGIFLFIKNNDGKEQNNEITNNYVAYISINPLIKLEYSQTCNEKKCDNPIVIKYELVNDDAKNIYKDVDLIGTNRNLYDVITLISKTADENNIEFENVEIYSNWDNLNNYIENSDKGDYKWSYIINIRDKENLEDISSALEENKILYNIEFDTNGGNEIITQTVEKGKLATQPTTPTKNGYKFIEWQLDGKAFDFNTEITSDITLKAKWKKIETSNNSTNKNENNTTTNNNSNTDNNSNNNTNNDTNNNQNTNENTNNTPSQEDTHKGFINLNDNVQYYKGTSCGGYQAIKSSCINKTYRELMNEFPDNYSSELDDPETLEWLNLDEKIYEKSSLISYFPGCKTTISSSAQNTINKTPGFYGDFRNDGFMKPNWIYFTNSQYDKFKGDIYNFEKYGLYDVTACGGAGDGELKYYILDESSCEKYNLSCDRW